MPEYDQGQSNACGTTSLAMILGFLLNRRVDRTMIDREIRRQDSFSSPNDLVSYARRAGLNAEMYDGGSPAELVEFVDRGIPTQLLVSANGSGDLSSSHYVIVTGYARMADGNVSFTIRNPAGGGDEVWSAAELEARWGSAPGGFDHFFMAYARSNVELPRSRVDGVQGVLNAIDGAASVIAGYDRVARARSPGELLRGFGDIGNGVQQAIAGGVIAGLQFGVDGARAELGQLPVVGAPLKTAIDDLGERLATSGRLISIGSDAASQATAAMEHLANGEFGAAFSRLTTPLPGLAKSLSDTAQDALSDTLDVAASASTSVADAATQAGEILADGLGTAAKVAKGAGKSLVRAISSLF